MKVSLDFALYTGMTLASFIPSGTMPCSRDKFTIIAIGTQHDSHIFFTHACICNLIAIRFQPHVD